MVSTMPTATATIAYTGLKSNTACQTSCERFLHPLFSERCMSQTHAGECHHRVGNGRRYQRSRHLTNARRFVVGLDCLHKHRRHVAVARYNVVIEVGLLDRAILDTDALSQRQPDAVDDTALGLSDDVVRLYRNAAIDRAPDVVQLDLASAAIN